MNKRVFPYSLIFAILFLASCWQNELYEKYTQTDTGLFYKLQSFGDSTKKATFGDYLQLIITYKTDKDSVFYDTYSSNISGKVILPYNAISFKGSFEEHLKSMSEGDSVSFIVNADSLFLKFFKAELPIFLKKGDVVKMEVKLHRILNEQEYVQELKHYDELVEDADIEEHRRLQIYLDTLETKFTQLGNGLYFLPVKQGTGELARSGDRVSVQFKGAFLNGKLLESTYDRNQPFEFTLGEQGQVIKGIEISLKMLNEGAQAKFIIPSQLAYGSTGSSTGIVPPYTSLVYEIELIKIIK